MMRHKWRSSITLCWWWCWCCCYAFSTTIELNRTTGRHLRALMLVLRGYCSAFRHLITCGCSGTVVVVVVCCV
uniref:Secreted protein n=1 Tax=Anopheles darlingi TaxID=43151 RepID=A0A2M4D3P5_ANODA